jgi:glycosyltransferase involved in cell wall biosynthesis
MNILHIDDQRGWRGGEQQASYLIRAQARRGHRVVLCGRYGSEFLSRDHGAPVEARLAMPFRTEAALWSAWRLAGVTRRYDIEVVHAHSSKAHTAACLAKLFRARGKLIVSRRVDFPPKTDPLNRLKYKEPDHYVAISRRIREVLLEAGLSESKITVVHSGIDLARLDVPPLGRSELGVPEDAVLLGNAAALVGHKDHATLINAMAHVVREEPRAHVAIAGEGPLRRELEAQIESLGLGQHVQLLGHRHDLPRILRALGLFVFSSKEEGLGTSVLDAMACGVPVVATRAGGIPEMVEHGETGLLAPPQDPRALAQQVLAAMREPERSAERADKARRRVEGEFSVEAMVEGNLRVYEKALQPDPIGAHGRAL